MSKWIGGREIFTTMELISEFGSPLGSNSICTCCGRATMYAIRYPDRDTLFLCQYCDTARESA